MTESTLTALSNTMRSQIRASMVRQYGEAEVARLEARTPDEIAAEEAAARNAQELARREDDARTAAASLARHRMPIRGDLLEDIARRKYQRTKATRATGAWLRGQQRVFVLIGDPGTGKTVAGALVATLAHYAGRSCAYIRESDLVRLTHSPTVTHQNELDAIRDVNTLIIDECGQTLEESTERARIATGQMVDHRIGGTLRTMLIGNLTTEQLVARYGTRFSDRLREVGLLEVLKLEKGETSLRRQAQTPPRTEAAAKALRGFVMPGSEDL